MLEEPKRIGLTDLTASKLEELLESLNPELGEEGIKLIKFDLYRLAVSIGIKNAVKPSVLSDKSNVTLRTNEFDPENIFYTVLESSNLIPANVATYSFIEQLAEHGIKEFYDSYNKTGEIPFESFFKN